MYEVSAFGVIYKSRQYKRDKNGRFAVYNTLVIGSDDEQDDSEHEASYVEHKQKDIDIQGQAVEVDEGISNTISYLNNTLGVPTNFSCQGNPTESPSLGNGYISFAPAATEKQVVEALSKLGLNDLPRIYDSYTREEEDGQIYENQDWEEPGKEEELSNSGIPYLEVTEYIGYGEDDEFFYYPNKRFTLRVPAEMVPELEKRAKSLSINKSFSRIGGWKPISQMSRAERAAISHIKPGVSQKDRDVEQMLSEMWQNARKRDIKQATSAKKVKGKIVHHIDAPDLGDMRGMMFPASLKRGQSQRRADLITATNRRIEPNPEIRARTKKHEEAHATVRKPMSAAYRYATKPSYRVGEEGRAVALSNHGYGFGSGPSRANPTKESETFDAAVRSKAREIQQNIRLSGYERRKK